MSSAQHRCVAIRHALALSSGVWCGRIHNWGIFLCPEHKSLWRSTMHCLLLITAPAPAGTGPLAIMLPHDVQWALRGLRLPGQFHKAPSDGELTRPVGHRPNRTLVPHIFPDFQHLPWAPPLARRAWPSPEQASGTLWEQSPEWTF